jgi:hypothetical protein
MKKLNKEFEYKNYRFNTSIELNTKIEKRLNGKIFHTIITNCMGGSNYYQKEEIETHQIEEYTNNHYLLAINFVDKLENKVFSKEEEILINLGFN